MKARWFKFTVVVLLLAVVSSIIPACSPALAAESYLAVVPSVLQSGSTQSVSLALFNGDRLVTDKVEVALLKDGSEITQVSKTIRGKGTIELDIPDVEEGEYQVRVKGAGFEDEATVLVDASFVVFIETDKPIYKPGQTIHIRTITLTPELKPVVGLVTVEVLDAKGIKIFREDVETDEFGMTSLDLPISTEPNEGVWKITAITEEGRTQLDVRVEKYVLPKYEVSVELPKEWFLVDEPITGTILSEYSFGKPVEGELEIRASRYIGEWREYATFYKEIDGETDFELPAVEYVAGVPAAGGQGNVILDITVKEKATGYEETTRRMLTVSDSPLNLQLIPDSMAFKPGLPFGLLIVTETPDNQPLDYEVALELTYLDSDYDEIKAEEQQISTSNGKALYSTNPPESAVALIVEAYADGTWASITLQASYSPSGNFIHVEQVSEGIPAVGDMVQFKVNSTRRASNFYYEIVSRDKVVYSDYTGSSTIAFRATPLMTPSARLLVYQILPNSEVAADYIPFDVSPVYPHEVTAEFSQGEAEPGDEIEIDITTKGESKVGITAVDRAVYILAENRLNLQQVFAKLEQLYMQPQVELHEVSIYPTITTRGAMDVFEDAGVVVLSNTNIPDGKEYEASGKGGIFWGDGLWRGDLEMAAGEQEDEAGWPPAPQAINGEAGDDGLAEVERVRQFFPETWLWMEEITDADGRLSIDVTVPDTITTWMLRAVAISKESGLGIAEDELVAFQPFFLTIDLPYSAIRGEEFPVQVAIYNYLDESQSVQVEIEEAAWFDLLEDTSQTVEIDANDIGEASFMIRPTELGINSVKITARSSQAADAVIKTLIIEPEGISREVVNNLNISEGDPSTISTDIPFDAVDGSGRAYLTITSSYLTQTLEGLEELIQMPFGCGEQNMMMMAPDIYITKYLQESGQVKPEIMAKAELLMITGYQRELTYRRSDGSFSAFGESDDIGSLWLTAFVLKSFAEAADLIYIDESVLNEAKAWITSHQNADGSFDQVGFVHHQEILGGIDGKDALTAYVAIALMAAGDAVGGAKAVAYLEDQLSGMDDAYTLAITAYALELAGSARTDEAYQMLMDMAQEDEDGLHWGTGGDILPEQTRGFAPGIGRSADVEMTAYATLALIKHGDSFNASRAAKWLSSRRNAYGGYGSTQDTVVALQALTEYSTGTRADVDLTINITGGGINEQVRLTAENFDVLQVIEIPVNEEIEITATGEGEAVAQVVRRFNLLEAETGTSILNIDVEYDVTEVEVNDMVTVSVELAFNPLEPMEAGMVVADISIPTGFTAATETIAAAVEGEAKIKRYEIAGRKVIFYIENILPGESLSWSFQVKAAYPVKAKGVSSQVYSYYQPDIRGETLGENVVVSGD
ncbi:MAG TPA: alpha-2-macroglobulin [Dehalococcoidia bacterium]|nr:alpha-2-macroglobulin [Dehalococcoidia bacterium]